MIFVAALFPAHSSTRVFANVPVRAARTARGTVAVPGRKRSSTGSFGLTARNRTRRPRISTFDLCVAGDEAGAGEIVTLANARSYAHDIDWDMVDGEYESGFQWLPSTWAHQRSHGDPVLARDATPQQQAAVFNRFANASEWPESVPACE